jgi:predicted acyl esterase
MAGKERWDADDGWPRQSDQNRRMVEQSLSESVTDAPPPEKKTK